MAADLCEPVGVSGADARRWGKLGSAPTAKEGRRDHSREGKGAHEEPCISAAQMVQQMKGEGWRE